MTVAIVSIHVIACIALILIVLLQTGKGAEMGATFGGGNAMMGASGETPLLSKVTTGIAILFMITSLSLAYISGTQHSGSVMPGQTTSSEEAPAN